MLLGCSKALKQVPGNVLKVNSSCSFITSSWWAVGLEATCRFLYEKGQCWDLPPYTCGQGYCHSDLRKRPALRWWHQCTDFGESKISDESPCLDCPNEGVCWILLIVNSRAPPWLWKIRMRTAPWETDPMANQSGKCSILEPFPEFHHAHDSPGSPLKRNLFHFI